MDLEANQDDFMGSNDVTQIIKGKRTKRQRSSSPYKATMTSSSSSGHGGGGGGRAERGVIEEYGSIWSPTSSSDEVYESTEEEEDMANCLILLAQGDGPTRQVENNKGQNKMEKFSARKLSEMITPSINKAGFYVYECKTCNRSFPSFQALGGHRASHKKPKATVVEEKKVLGVASSMEDLDHQDCRLNKSSPDHHDGSVSLQISINNNNSNKGNFHGNNKQKIHECSICGSEFMSGQALGGHMRRHRANTVINQVGMSVDSSSANGDHDHHMIKPRNMLGLDLNLPAPEDHDHHLHHHESNKFRFASTQQAALVFSAPTLVDCHY